VCSNHTNRTEGPEIDPCGSWTLPPFYRPFVFFKVGAVAKNDYARVRQWREENRKPCPDGCGKIVAWDTIRCRRCHAIHKRGLALTRTVADLKQNSKSLRWTDHVRYFARKQHVFTSCVICGYSKHVEVCHIKDIADFPDTATIEEINQESNVIGLCPNHHWEFDNDQL
jgi:hypothetical protein